MVTASDDDKRGNKDDDDDHDDERSIGGPYGASASIAPGGRQPGIRC